MELKKLSLMTSSRAIASTSSLYNVGRVQIDEVTYKGTSYAFNEFSVESLP